MFARSGRLGLLWLTACASAPPRTIDAEVEALLRRGNELRRADREAEALQTFREAHARSRAPRTLAQLALAEYANRLWLEAEVHLEEALQSPSDPWIAQRLGTLFEARREIARHVGQLLVGGNVDGAEVRLDGRVVATLPMSAPIRVATGTVALEVRAAGHAPVSRRLELRPRQVHREEVRLTPIP